MCEAFNIGKAKAVILAMSQPMETNHAIVNLRRLYPDLKIFARAKDSKHQERLQKTLNVVAMVPILPEQNLLLTLPFGGAVLKSLGAPVEEVRSLFFIFLVQCYYYTHLSCTTVCIHCNFSLLVIVFYL